MHSQVSDTQAVKKTFETVLDCMYIRVNQYRRFFSAIHQGPDLPYTAGRPGGLVVTLECY